MTNIQIGRPKTCVSGQHKSPMFRRVDSRTCDQGQASFFGNERSARLSGNNGKNQGAIYSAKNPRTGWAGRHSKTDMRMGRVFRATKRCFLDEAAAMSPTPAGNTAQGCGNCAVLCNILPNITCLLGHEVFHPANLGVSNVLGGFSESDVSEHALSGTCPEVASHPMAA